jgi:hypothetical protein
MKKTRSKKSRDTVPILCVISHYVETVPMPHGLTGY